MGRLWSYFLIYTLFILLCYFFLPNDALGGNKTDEEALLQFKAKISDDPLGVMSSWNSSLHFCQWNGVICSRRHPQRVVRLDLYSKKLSGSISPYIGNLSFLTALYLFNNSFSHEIPPEISRLRRLRVLRLDNNSIGGIIPTNISACFNLIHVRFSVNQLVGKIPVELGFLLKLKRLAIWGNNLTGSIPDSIGNLSTLSELSVTQNNLEGAIPDALGNLKSITFFSVYSNGLSGNIPPSIFNLSSMETFDVGSNQLHGTLPSNLGITLPNLQIFAIGSNQFTGSIPLSMSNASNIVELAFPVNKFTGNVPSLEKLNNLHILSFTSNHLGSGRTNDLSFLSSLINATRLTILSMDDNNLGGVLPDFIGNFSTELYVLTFSGNMIFGSIPTGIGNLTNLEILGLSDNQFSGNIPFEFGKLQKLGLLFISRNKISGKIPSSLGNLTNLIKLYLETNNLQGNIPTSLSKCQNLIILLLYQNNLTGAIPPKLFSLTSLSIALDLSQNRLIGSLPTEVGNLKILGQLDLSKNLLSGEIPSSLSSCISLETLFINNNFFGGPIPLSLSSLKGIQYLDLSRNNFTGKIPEFLASLKLLYLDLSFNDFEGVVPVQGVFKNESAVSVMNNSKLCGGMPEFHLPKCNFKDHKKKTLTLAVKLILSIASALLGVTFVLSILFLFWLRKKRKGSPENSLGNQLMMVSYGSLLKATDEFSSTNLIGVGSFGSVYKGILDPDNMIVAIKVLNLFRPGASKSFIAECEALKNIRHRNLVKVLTACSGVDYHGNDFKALVYEFMVNGSLDEWLHPILGTSEARGDPRNLNFMQRLSIAIDIACALEYLHHHCQIVIVHCDLKPSNVLLDDELNGHIGDFGLAKLFQEAINNFSVSQTSSVGIRGSVGYAPPEYGMGTEVSTYGDVYSYGILLLEMFTGKRPTDNMFKDGLNLHNFAKAALPERMVEITDPILLREIVEGEKGVNNNQHQRLTEGYKIQECLSSIIRVGVACSTELPRNRMNINDVVVELRLIKDKLFPTSIHGERRTINALQSAGI